jgi:hypothetical protein
MSENVQAAKRIRKSRKIQNSKLSEQKMTMWEVLLGRMTCGTLNRWGKTPMKSRISDESFNFL